jgi:hypothetical protein
VEAQGHMEISIPGLTSLEKEYLAVLQNCAPNLTPSPPTHSSTGRCRTLAGGTFVHISKTTQQFSAVNGSCFVGVGAQQKQVTLLLFLGQCLGVWLGRVHLRGSSTHYTAPCALAGPTRPYLVSQISISILRWLLWLRSGSNVCSI